MELFSPCLGDPFLFRVTSVQPSWLFFFRLDLTRALGLRLLVDGDGGRCVFCCCCCCGCCLFIAVGFLGAKLGDMADLFAPPAPGASFLHHHHHLPVPAD